MSSMLLLDADGPALPEPAVQAAVREAFRQLATGRAVQPPQTVTDLPGGGDVIVYQAALADAGVYAVKASPYLPQPDGPAVVTAWTLLISTRTGRPLLLADSGRLTAERTAATTALAVDLLAPATATSLAVIGLGPVGRAHLRHARVVRDFQQIRVYSRSAAPEAVADLGDVQLAASADDAAAGADVVLLCTSAAGPVIDVRRLAPGTLVTSVSTNAPMAHEVDPAALVDLDIYADYARTAVASAGEMRLAGLGAEQIRGDLPSLVTGTAPAPRGDRPVFFRSIGLGLEDAAVALVALRLFQASA